MRTYYSRRPYKPRRYYANRRPYAPRRRAYRRRRLWIRRPRAGSYYTQRMQTINPLNVTIASGKNYHTINITWELNQFVSHTFFDMYRILKVKWEVKPITNPFKWDACGYGVSIIDYDDNKVDPTPTGIPWGHNSTRRLFNPAKGHSRYFTPKPKLITAGDESMVITRKSPFWINAYNTNTTWLGMKACWYTPTAQQQFNYAEIKTVWVRWRQAI